MPSFTNKELDSIKDLVATHQVLASKLTTYSNSCQSSDVKQMFQTAATEAQRSAQNLIQILG